MTTMKTTVIINTRNKSLTLSPNKYFDPLYDNGVNVKIRKTLTICKRHNDLVKQNMDMTFPMSMHDL